jgi:hypothetical protein
MRNRQVPIVTRIVSAFAVAGVVAVSAAAGLNETAAEEPAKPAPGPEKKDAATAAKPARVPAEEAARLAGDLDSPDEAVRRKAAETLGREAPDVEPFLLLGKLADGERHLLEALAKEPARDDLRTGLGVVRLLRGVERMSQSLHRHGFRSSRGGFWAGGMWGFTRVPVPENPKPGPLDYAGFRRILQQWVDDLADAEATLSTVSDPTFKLPLHVALFRLDLDGDGKAGPGETGWRLLAAAFPRLDLKEGQAAGFRIGFDLGDVLWLRGYIHVLSAITEAFLVPDEKRYFDHYGHEAFEGVPAPPADAKPPEWTGKTVWAKDARQRLRSILAHLEAVTELSRASWKAILAETDDDDEWLPNPRQAGVLGIKVTQEQIDLWTACMGELGEWLSGRKVLNSRGDAGGIGYSIRRLLLELPDHEDRWFAADDWLRAKGPPVDTEVFERGWRALSRGGDPLMFGLWFN